MLGAFGCSEKVFYTFGETSIFSILPTLRQVAKVNQKRNPMAIHISDFAGTTIFNELWPLAANAYNQPPQPTTKNWIEGFRSSVSDTIWLQKRSEVQQRTLSVKSPVITADPTRKYTTNYLPHPGARGTCASSTSLASGRRRTRSPSRSS